MAKEFKLPYTASEVNEKLKKIDNKADLIDGKVPLEQLPDDIGGSGGLTEVSWEDVQDKPFYDTRIGSYYSQAENPNPVSFDNAMIGYSFYKVSDLIPTREEIFNSVKVIVNENTFTPKENEIQFETDDFIMAILDGSYGFVFINKSGTLNFTYQGYQMSLEVPEVGIYYILPLGTSVPSGRTIEFILGGELKTLDIKYLPSNMALGYEVKGEGIIWDGNTEGLTEAAIEFEADGALMKLAYYKMSDKTPSINEVIGRQLRAIIEGEEAFDTVSEDMIMVFSDNGSYLINDVSIAVCLNDNTVLPCTEMIGAPEDIIFPEKGIWFAKVTAAGVPFIQVSALTSPDTLVPIDEKFIPDTIARQSDLDNIDLSNYYTKNETYSKYDVYNKNEVDFKISNVKVDLSEYYTKNEVDEMLGDIDTVINEINALIGE